MKDNYFKFAHLKNRLIKYKLKKGGLKMEYLEKEINEGELTVLNILTALDCMYSDSFPKHIQE